VFGITADQACGRSVLLVRHVVVSGFKTSTLPNTLFQAFYSAQCLGANKATIVEEIANKSVKVSVDDDRSLIRSLRKKRVLEGRGGSKSCGAQSTSFQRPLPIRLVFKSRQFSAKEVIQSVITLR
jgi:hypothetical protein